MLCLYQPKHQRKEAQKMIEEFNAANPDYEPMEYCANEELLKLENSVRFTGGEIDHAMKSMNLSGNAGRMRPSRTSATSTAEAASTMMVTPVSAGES